MMENGYGRKRGKGVRNAMMLIKNGRVIDPKQGTDEVLDLVVENR